MLRSLGNVARCWTSINSNSFAGALPGEIVEGLQNVKQLNLANNKFAGALPYSICRLKKLANFTASSNYFDGKVRECAKRIEFDGRSRRNCLIGEGEQRATGECVVAASNLSTICGQKKESSSSSSSMASTSTPPPSSSSSPLHSASHPGCSSTASSSVAAAAAHRRTSQQQPSAIREAH